MTTDALARRATITEMVRAFEKAEADTRAAFALLVQAEAEVNAVFAPGATCRAIRIDSTHNGYHDDFTKIELAVTRMRRDAWKQIVDRLELRRMLSLARYEAIGAELSNDKTKLPPITEESVHAFIARFAAELPVMIGEAVREVFDWLRPRSYAPTSKLKTNQRNARFELGPKVVIGNCLQWGSPNGTTSYQVRHNYRQNFVALENVFRNLDGGGSFTRNWQSDIEAAIEASGHDGRGATSYFRFACFGNMNLHLWFLRPDLLAKLNRMAGGKNLHEATAPRS